MQFLATLHLIIGPGLAACSTVSSAAGGSQTMQKSSGAFERSGRTAAQKDHSSWNSERFALAEFFQAARFGIPALVLYATAIAEDDGRVFFLKDIYMGTIRSW